MRRLLRKIYHNLPLVPRWRVNSELRSRDTRNQLALKQQRKHFEDLLTKNVTAHRLTVCAMRDDHEHKMFTEISPLVEKLTRASLERHPNAASFGLILNIDQYSLAGMSEIHPSYAAAIGHKVQTRLMQARFATIGPRESLWGDGLPSYAGL